MKFIKETPGNEFEVLTVLETVLFTNITGKIVTAGMYETGKRGEIAKLLTILASQFKYDLNKPIDFICAKILLNKSIYNN